MHVKDTKVNKSEKTSMDKVSQSVRFKSKTIRIVEDIWMLREQNRTDREIKNMLGLKDRQWRRYNAIVTKEIKEMWSSLIHEKLELEMLRMYKTLNNNYAKIESKLGNETNPETIIMLTQELQDIALNKVRLLICGPEYTETDDYRKKRDLNIEYMAMKR